MNKTLAKSDPAVIWASCFGVGWIPWAPGTWGSAVAVVFWWFILAGLPWFIQLLIVALYFASGWIASAIVARRYQVDDASEIVADEVAGMWLALIFVPQIWWGALLAFGLFRCLDILKPGPIGWLDRNVHGGLGVMLDDLLAGAVIAALCLLLGGMIFA